MHSKLPTLDLSRADFGFFMDLLSGVPWDKGLERGRAQESWLTFKDCLLQPQKQGIPIMRKSGKTAGRDVWINKGLLDKFK